MTLMMMANLMALIRVTSRISRVAYPRRIGSHRLSTTVVIALKFVSTRRGWLLRILLMRSIRPVVLLRSIVSIIAVILLIL